MVPFAHHCVLWHRLAKTVRAEQAATTRIRNWFHLSEPPRTRVFYLIHAYGGICSKWSPFSGRKWKYLRKVMTIWVRGQMVVFTQKVLKNLLMAFEQIETFPHMTPLAFMEPFEQILAFALNGHICRPAVPP